MKKEGYGGSAGVTHVQGSDARVLAGVLSEDVTPAGSHKMQCAHPICDRWFLTRQDGDNYCSQACEFADNPQYKGGRSSAS